ncbi:hypothetical protein [Pseudonocardia sp.]|uniref:hypothetical protein n=1 Tax=Pseudonocardia sp. TaxID=60912 RepID=UPI0031FC98D6
MATETPGMLAEVDRVGLAAIATHMLADVQDLVIPHLSTPTGGTTTGRMVVQPTG